MRIKVIKGFVFLLMFAGNVKAQIKTEKETGLVPKAASGLYLNIGLPIGQFSQTHSIGINIAYERNIALREKKANFLYGINAGLFFGKEETVSSYNYRYKPYLMSGILGGLSYQFSKKINGNAVVGPSLAAYNNSTRFCALAKATAQYQFNKKMMGGFSTIMIQTMQTRPLLSSGLLFTYLL